jgi:hypothetical protein
VIATVLFCVVIGSIWFFGLRSMRSAVDQYTAREFALLPPISIAAEARSSAALKLAELQTAAQDGRGARVEFTQPEVQALIESTPWKDWLRIGIAGDELSLTFAFPLAALGDWQAASFLVGDISERALVGNARCNFQLIDKTPKLKFLELVLNGHLLEDLPRGHAGEWITGAIAQAAQDPESGTNLPLVLRAIAEARVVDGKLSIAVGATPH